MLVSPNYFNTKFSTSMITYLYYVNTCNIYKTLVNFSQVKELLEFMLRFILATITYSHCCCVTLQSVINFAYTMGSISLELQKVFKRCSLRLSNSGPSNCTSTHSIPCPNPVSFDHSVNQYEKGRRRKVVGERRKNHRTASESQKQHKSMNESLISANSATCSIHPFVRVSCLGLPL